MFDQQHRYAELAAQLVDQVLQLDLLLRVEAGRRLVEHQEARLGDHAARDLQAPLVPVRQRARRPVRDRRQPHPVEPHGRAFERFLLGTAIRGRREQAGQQPRLHLAVLRDEQVLDDGQRLEQADVLERAQALQRDLVARQPANRVAVEHDVAAGRLVEAADAVEHRGLARAVRPDDREHLIATHVEIDPVHREQPAEAHLQPGDLQQFRIRAHWGSSTWGRLAGSRPCGRHIIINTITRPKISIRYSAKPRATSGSTVSRIAARITPSCGPSRRARRSRGSAPIR